MIYESYPWKKDLARRKNLIIKYNTKAQFDKNDEAAYTAIEKGIFYSAFVIRKLIDCKVKLSDAAEKYQLKVKEVKPLKRIDLWHRFPQEDNYDWENAIKKTVQGTTICNSLIHSFVFNIIEDCENDIPVTGFMVSSDFDKNKLLYMVDLNVWFGYIDFIATDSIVSSTMKYDSKSNDYVYKGKKRG